MSTTEIILTVLLAVLTIAATFLSYYLYIRRKAQEAAEGAIGDAEEFEKTATEKLEQATEQVYSIIPSVLKFILTKEVVRAIVQKVFDRIKTFAEKEAANHKKKEAQKQE